MRDKKKIVPSWVLEDSSTNSKEQNIIGSFSFMVVDLPGQEKLNRDQHWVNIPCWWSAFSHVLFGSSKEYGRYVDKQHILLPSQ